MQARGLKHGAIDVFGLQCGSRLMQARGLKRLMLRVQRLRWPSRLMQARGLKPDALLRQRKRGVAPHAGAWIETGVTSWRYRARNGRASCRRVD